MTKPTITSKAAGSKGGRPTPQDSVRLTERILETATQMFLTAGFEATSIDAIAALSGVSKRTLYARFAMKSELFEAVIVKFVEERAKKLEMVTVTSGTLYDQFVSMAAEMLRICSENTTVALDRVVTGEAHRFPELGRILYENGTMRAKCVVVKVLERAQAEGEIDTVDTALAAEHFLHVTAIGPMRRVVLGLDDSRMTPERMKKVRFSVGVFLKGLGYKGPIGRA